MIFLYHMCSCNVGFQIDWAKYKVIIRLATMIFLLDKSRREEKNQKD